MYSLGAKNPLAYRNLNVTVPGSLIKAGRGKIIAIHLHTTYASEKYVKFYDKSFAPVVGTDTPFLTIPVTGAAPFQIYFEDGIPFTNGLGIGATTMPLDNANGAPGVNTIFANILYL